MSHFQGRKDASFNAQTNKAKLSFAIFIAGKLAMKMGSDCQFEILTNKFF